MVTIHEHRGEREREGERGWANLTAFVSAFSFAPSTFSVGRR